MNPRTPLICTYILAAFTHAAALFTLAKYGTRIALNFTIPVLGSLAAIWLTRHGTQNHTTRKTTK